jgi:hypothetical protein
MSWKTAINMEDPDEFKVFMALDGDNHTWRTIGGISRQTGLSEGRVSEIIAKYSPQLTRLSETPSFSGSALVGLVENVGPAFVLDT